MRQKSSHIDSIIKAQHNIRNDYIAVVEDKDKKTAEYLKQIFRITKNDNRNVREQVYKRILSELEANPFEKQQLLEHYAKIMDIERRVRKIKNAEYYNKSRKGELEAEITPTADHFDYVLAKMEEENVPPHMVQKFFNENAVAAFSLTMHPTNPISVEYTKAGLEFDNMFGNGEGYSHSLRSLRDAKLAGSKKTPVQEMEETIAILDTIYDAALTTRNNLIKALENYPRFRKYIDVNKPIIQPCVWATGDGDGNDNIDIKALQDGAALLKKRIKELYIKDVQHLKAQLLGESKTYLSNPTVHSWKIDRLDKVITNIEEDKYRSPSELIEELEEIKEAKDIIYKINTFGLHYAKIDIRHNAIDIMATIARLAKTVHFIDNEKEFLSKSPEEQKTAISEWFKSSYIINTLASINLDKLGNDATGKMAARIFGRLKVLKDDPNISDKLIIAETNCAAHVLAALTLLKAAGNKVAEKGTAIDIVTLSESVPDLEMLPKLMEELVADPIYREHLNHRQKLIPMIAKSDTVRRNGRGAEAAQEEAIGAVYALGDRFRHKYPELANMSIEGFNGGGAALQRGGGRVTEVAHNHGRAARAKGATTMGPSTLTIQGHQMQILFSEVADQTIEALAAQNFYARAQTEQKENGRRYVASRKVARGVNEKLAAVTFENVCKVMRDEYFKYMGDLDDPKDPGNASFNKLFEEAPWVSVILGNLSSRPSKRGGSTNTGKVTVQDLKGKEPKILNNRAITVERLAAHSGTHFLTYLSVYEGLRSVEKPKELPHMYRANKSTRDFMRNTALALHMTDFDHAWSMMIGEKHPSREVLENLAKNFEQRKYDKAQLQASQKELNKETLAWLETYAYKVAKLVYYCIEGKQAPQEFSLQAPLEHSFPDLAVQLKARELDVEFGRYAEADMTYRLNNNPQLKLDETMISIIQAIYASADVVNAPEGGLSIGLTRKEADKIEQLVDQNAGSWLRRSIESKAEVEEKDGLQV
jgi:phosphoenolpyruvate carboxylase